MRTLLLVVLALLTFATPSLAQKHCVKGIPCGGSCISATKVCHVGSGSATSAPRATSPLPTAVPDGARFVASSRGQVYYLASCRAARNLSAANRIYFKTDQEAAAAGYRPSASAGCSTGNAAAGPAIPPGDSAAPKRN